MQHRPIVLLFLVISLALIFTKPAGAEDKGHCSAKFIQPVIGPNPTGEAADPLLIQAVAELSKELESVCESPEECSPEFAIDAAQGLMNKNPRGALSRVWNAAPTVGLRRVLVVSAWILTMIGPGVATAQLTEGMEPKSAGVLIGLIMGISGSFFGYFGLPVTQRIGPHLASFAMWLWAPDKNDHWGKTLAIMNDKERTVADYLSGLFLVLEGPIRNGGEALVQNDLDLAAKEYLLAILHGFYQFKGANLDHKSVILEISIRANEFAGTPPQTRELLVHKILSQLQRLPMHQLPDGMTHERLIIRADQTLRQWFALQQD
jgi:hypothetical protein